MSEFEYIAVLVSLILGLGIAHVLSGVGRTINRRQDFKMDAIHVLWSFAIFVVLSLNWWVFFQMRSFDAWTFEIFLAIIVWAVLFYLMAVVLYPTDMDKTEDYGEVFGRNRAWFLGLFLASNLSDIILTALRGNLFNPPFYLPFVLHFIVLGSIGLLTKSRRYHVFLASYVLFVSLSWAFIVRLFLV